MGCHLVRLTGEARARVSPRFRFRGVRHTYGEVESGPPSLCHSRVDCQIGAPPRSGGECLRCPRLLSWQAGPGEREVTLRCVWLHSDPVADRMTGSAALVSVSSSRRCVEADRVAVAEGVHRLLVIDEGRVVGIVCRCDLERALQGRVRAVMQPNVHIIDAATTLGEAAAVMRTLDVGCLPVARERRIVGIITRGDLIRSGLPAELLS